MNRNTELAPTLLTVGLAFTAGAALAWGLAALLAHWRGSAVQPTDDIVARRVRAHAAQTLADPEAVQVTVTEGLVRVAGQIRQEERERFLVSLVDLPGVWRVHNALTVFPSGSAG